MRHRKKFNHLGRTPSHRKALLKNMACSLIEHKRINTTVAKAKALRTFVEPIITRAKDDSTHSRRTTFRYLQNKYAVQELFNTVGPKISERPGGYCRIIKTGFRLGDSAEMAMIELVDFNDIYNPNEETKKTTRRSRRGGTKKATTENKEEVLDKKTSKEATKKEKVETKVEAKKEEVKAKVEEIKAKVEAKTEPKKEETQAKAETKSEAKAEEKGKKEEK